MFAKFKIRYAYAIYTGWFQVLLYVCVSVCLFVCLWLSRVPGRPYDSSVFNSNRSQTLCRWFIQSDTPHNITQIIIIMIIIIAMIGRIICFDLWFWLWTTQHIRNISTTIIYYCYHCAALCEGKNLNKAHDYCSELSIFPAKFQRTLFTTFL